MRPGQRSSHAEAASRSANLRAQSSTVDHERVVVTSPFASFVCYRLRDAVLIPVLHLERHRLQAVRVTEHEGFPWTPA